MKTTNFRANPPIGTHVRSYFRARWYGTVVGDAGALHPPWCVRVLRTHDRNGRPMDRRSFAIIDRGWLEVVDALPSWPPCRGEG